MLEEKSFESPKVRVKPTWLEVSVRYVYISVNILQVLYVIIIQASNFLK